MRGGEEELFKETAALGDGEAVEKDCQWVSGWTGRQGGSGLWRGSGGDVDDEGKLVDEFVFAT